MFICNHCPYVKSVRERIVRDARELQQFGINCIAIMSNDVSEYAEDSFDNMKIIAQQYAYPFPYVWDETQQVARQYGAVCTPDFLVSTVIWNCNIAGDWIVHAKSWWLMRHAIYSMHCGKSHKPGKDARANCQHGLLDQMEKRGMTLGTTRSMSATLKAIIAAVKLVAAEEIMPRYLKVAHQRKSDGSLCTEADLAAQNALSKSFRPYTTCRF